MKLSEFLNKKINTKNNQISFDVRKKELKKFGIKPEDIMSLELPKSFQKVKENKNKFEEDFELKWKL